jgi:tetratricopeptide (TPR) repeat protein
MSHINEALKKAQKERDARHLKYRGLFAARGKKRNIFSGKVLWWTLVCLVLMVIVFKYNPWMGDTATQTTTESENKIKKPVQVPVKRATTGPEGKNKKPVSGRAPQSSTESEDKIKKPVQVPVKRATRGPESKIKKPVAGPGPATQTRKRSEDKIKKPAAIQEPTVVEKARESYSRAKIFHRRGRLNQAKRLYQETLKTDPGYVDALNNLGVIFIQEGNYPAAQRYFEKAMRLKPAYAEPFYNLACLYAIKGEVKLGLALLERAVSIDTTARDWARKDSDLENLRGTPEFEVIVGK